MWKRGNLGALCIGMQTGTITTKNAMEFSQTLKIEQLYNTAIPLLVIDPKKMRSLSQRDNRTPMFIETLFKTTNTWKQPKCP